nr:MAG TPA: hypothetical protein [Caudoviricetes sp.]
MKKFKISKELFVKVKTYWLESDKNWKVKGVRISDVYGFSKVHDEVKKMWNETHENLSPEVIGYIADNVLGNMLEKEVVMDYDVENAYNEAFGEDDEDILTSSVLGYRTLTILNFMVDEVKIHSKL